MLVLDYGVHSSLITNIARFECARKKFLRYGRKKTLLSSLVTASSIDCLPSLITEMDTVSPASSRG